MGNLFNALNDLRTNIFGGGNTGKTTPIIRRTAVGMNTESPMSKLEHDPYQYSSIQYPRDLTTNGGIGHYMLFYINVQDKTKYVYNAAGGGEVGGVTEVVTPGKPAEYFGKGSSRRKVADAVPATSEFKTNILGALVKGYDRRNSTSIDSDVVQLSATRQNKTGMSSFDLPS